MCKFDFNMRGLHGTLRCEMTAMRRLPYPPTAHTSFSGGHAENHASHWLRSFCETGVSGSQTGTAEMPET